MDINKRHILTEAGWVVADNVEEFLVPTNEQVHQRVEELGVPSLIMPEHANAVVRLEVTPKNDVRVVYRPEIIIQNLEKDMSRSDAEDYYFYNIEQSYLGNSTPIFEWEDEEDECDE